MKNIGKQLRKIRDEKGFPQKLIAEHLGLHRTNYSRIENNLQKLTPEQIILFCEFCDVSANYLLGVKSNNEKGISTTDINEINEKLKKISDLINN